MQNRYAQLACLLDSQHEKDSKEKKFACCALHRCLADRWWGRAGCPWQWADQAKDTQIEHEVLCMNKRYISQTELGFDLKLGIEFRSRCSEFKCEVMFHI